MNNKREDYNLIYSKIGGCLRNEQSDYAIQVVHDLMENHAQYKTVKLIDNIKKLEQSNKQWIEESEEIEEESKAWQIAYEQEFKEKKAKDKEIEELKEAFHHVQKYSELKSQELERLKKGIKGLKNPYNKSKNFKKWCSADYMINFIKEQLIKQ